MKILVPFYPLYVSTEREDYFRICTEAAGSGEIIPVNKTGAMSIIERISGAVVHGHGRGLPFPEAACLLAGRAVYSFYNNFIGQKWYAVIIRRFLFNLYDKVIVHTEYTRKNYIRQGIRKDKIEILDVPVDCEYFSQPAGGSGFRKKYGLEGTEPFAITVGTGYHKNPEVIIEACRQAGVKLVVVGFKNKLESRERYPGFSPAKEVTEYKDSGNVIFTGYIDKQDLRAAYDAASIYINSSDDDGEVFGITVYEAAAAGVPLCLPDYGTFDVFKGCALFHSNHDPVQLAQNIKRYLKDKQLYEKNKQQAKIVSARFDYNIVKQQYKAFYQRLGFI